MLNDAVINNLLNAGGKRWTKLQMDRIYVSPAALGFTYTKYNTGNVSSAFIGENRISNRAGRAILDSKSFIDVKTGACKTTVPELQQPLEAFLAAAQADAEAEA